jgi:hypothetical protein
VCFFEQLLRAKNSAAQKKKHASLSPLEKAVLSAKRSAAYSSLTAEKKAAMSAAMKQTHASRARV